MTSADHGWNPDQLRHHSAQQSALARFGQQALGSEGLDEILTEACRLVGEALGTGLAKVMEIQPDGETLLVRAGVGWPPGVVGQASTKASERNSEGHALKTKRPMISPDSATETRFSYPEFLVKAGVKAVANVVIGVAKGDRPLWGAADRQPRAAAVQRQRHRLLHHLRQPDRRGGQPAARQS
ncbi:GAF domain-containing protein [Dankookia rubra]|uniref:GAF domain-containing protein n=1 Tax=Dankookia rubra TaxID=1442381 RepID=UPI0014086FD8|nr:GAF domain-containing protein [Dankookia rubra]